MRFATFLMVSVALALLSTGAESTRAQLPGDKGKPGGFPGNPALFDKLFDLLSKGGDTIAIANAPASIRPAMEDFAKVSKIDNGMLTRQQFQAFYEVFQLGKVGPGKGLNIDAAAVEKFRQHDVNGDGRLTPDEMPAALRAVVKKYDKGGGGNINVEEFKLYFRDSLQLSAAPGGPGKGAPPKSDKTPDTLAEDVLRDAGLRTDPDALLEYFRERTLPKASLDEMLALVRQLGDPDPPARARAVARVLARGPWAIPALRQILTSLDDPLAAPLARNCLEWLEGPRRVELPGAAAQLLAARKPGEAAAVLLAYLPLADEPRVVDAVKAALDRVAARPGPVDAALLAALNDTLPLRRVVAVEVLAGSNRPEVLPDLRKVMAQAPPPVKLRAALALARQLDEQAVTVLIDLLAELPAAERPRVEEALKQLAGEWSPSPNLHGEDELSRKIRREAWVSWWKTLDGPALLAAFRQRTLTPEDAIQARALVAQLADKSLAKREQASAELTALGPKVVGVLREAANSANTEQARWAEKCLKDIAQQESKGKLPLAAPRLLAVRRPAGATAALLAFLPFTEDSAMKEEVVKAAQALVRADGPGVAEALAALADERPVCRQAAAEILAGAGGDKQKAAVRKLLTDADPAVRLRVAVLLVRARDREAVPALINLVAELPREQARDAEEFLYRLAGNGAPAVPPGNDPGAQQKFRAAWQAWWKEHGAKVDLTVLDAVPVLVGVRLTVVAEMLGQGPRPGFGKKGLPAVGGKDRLVALDGKGQIQWQIDNLNQPIDFQVLPNNRVLIAEYSSNRITERDFTGKVVWEVTDLPGNPVNVQRLPNGHTFIALYNNATVGGLVMEVDRAGKKVASFNVGTAPAGVNNVLPPNDGLLIAAHKTKDGHLICLSTKGTCVRLDANQKEVKRFQVTGVNNGVFSREGNIDVTPKGHILFVQNNSAVMEYDADGKLVWQSPASGNRATRLPSGNTLVASQGGSVVELDSTGRTVWQYQPPAGYVALRARQTGRE
jgi:HEAT repeat protein